MFDVSPEVYELLRLVVNLAHCLYDEYGGGLRHPFARKHMISVLTSDIQVPDRLNRYIHFSCIPVVVIHSD